MAKKAYIGVSNIARNIKKIYVGVNNVARKVKKAYVGVNGVARLFFWREVRKITSSITLSTARRYMGSTHIGNYAIFAGGAGTSISNKYALVDTVTKTLATGTATNLAAAKHYMGSTHNGSYALFGGGYTGSYVRTIDAYNSSLSRSTPTQLISGCGGNYPGATHIGNYALFGGGRTASSTYGKKVCAYNNSLTQTTCSDFSGNEGLTDMGSTHVGNYAIFAGGASGGSAGSHRANVTTYNSSLVMAAAEDLSVARTVFLSGYVGNYALFIGGQDTKNTASKKVDVYDNNLVHTTASNMPDAINNGVCINMDDYLLCVKKGYAYIFTRSLVRSTIDILNPDRENFAGTHIGDYALIAGGYSTNPTAVHNAIDIYEY